MSRSIAPSGLLLALVRSLPFPEPLRVRGTAEVAPYVAATSTGWSGGEVASKTAGLRDPAPVDVLVRANVEMPRALEGGEAVVNSGVDIAAIPGCLRSPPATRCGVRSLADVRQKGEVMVLGGPAAYEARRALGGGGTARVREGTDRQGLLAASVALLARSLAGSDKRIAVPEVPALRATAVAAGAERYVRFLGSEAGQRVFATCGSTASR